MATAYQFADARLSNLDGFEVEIDEAHERAFIILNHPASP
jgi:2-oxoglutaroyl-CoA hydrolase